MADDTPILVCARVKGPLLMADNLTGPCAMCGWTVQFRPHAPVSRILRCVQCMSDTITPEDTVEVTPETVEDLKKLFLGRKH